MKVIIDKETNQVVGINIPATIFQIEIKVPDTQNVQEGMFADEVLGEKYLNLLNASEFDYIIADAFLTEDDLDLAYENHKADTGSGMVRIHPQGSVRTKEITLEVENSKLRYGVLEFDADPGIDIWLDPFNIINFKNTTDKFAFVKSYALGYKEAVTV